MLSRLYKYPLDVELDCEYIISYTNRDGRNVGACLTNAKMRVTLQPQLFCECIIVYKNKVLRNVGADLANAKCE